MKRADVVEGLQQILFSIVDDMHMQEQKSTCGRGRGMRNKVQWTEDKSPNVREGGQKSKCQGVGLLQVLMFAQREIQLKENK